MEGLSFTPATHTAMVTTLEERAVLLASTILSSGGIVRTFGPLPRSLAEQKMAAELAWNKGSRIAFDGCAHWH